MARPFPYLGHGTGTGDALRAWIVVNDAARAKSLVARIASWARTFKLKITTHTDGPIVALDARGLRKLGAKRSATAQAKLDDALVADASAIAFVARDGERVKTSAWHAETSGDPAPLLRALERVVVRPQRKYARAGAQPSIDQRLDMRELLFETLEGNARAELARATLDALARNAKGAARAVLDDVFEEHLPAMLGHDFDLDVVLRDAIAAARGLSATSIPMRHEFHVECERRMTRAHGTFVVPKAKLDWKRVGSVRAAIKRGALRDLAFALDDSTTEFAKTLLALTHDERLKLASHALLALRMANIATHLMTREEFESALTLYDAALEGDLPVEALANPLYAVQNDNNHLGVNAARARRYLERCLRARPEGNPTIFLNASFVCMEIDERDEAIRMLALAKKHGIAIERHRNEGLFIPLRERADFVKLMK